MKTFDWIVVGGGVAGISLSEILTREGHSVALVEKKNKLSSVTTKEFHEWVHTGSLYTLAKDPEPIKGPLFKGLIFVLTVGYNT